MTPEFSIIIPTFGRVGRLNRALASVCRQLIPSWECFVVNDNPGARALVDAALKSLSDTRFKVIHNPANLGAAAATNRAIAASQGHNIAFVDDDDEWLPGHLIGLSKRLDELSCPCLVYSNCILRWECHPPRHEYRKSPFPGPNLLQQLEAGTFHIPTLSCIAFSRQCIDLVSGLDEELASAYDLDFYLALSVHFRFSMVLQWSVIYSQHLDGRLTHDIGRYAASYRKIAAKWKFGDDFVRRKLRGIIRNASLNEAVLAQGTEPSGAETPPGADVRRVAALRRRPQTILFFSSNGVGMGHLTRLLAIARRCPSPLEPVFVTMSQAMAVINDFGYLAEYLPDHKYLGCDVLLWNAFLREELVEYIKFYDAAVVVFDCNYPFHGLLQAIEACPGTSFVWCRRGMWQPGHGATWLDRERHFDVVLEPRDFAGALDAGVTAPRRDGVRKVHPIRLLDDDECLPQAEARQMLGLEPAATAVLLQLGAANNYDFSAVRDLALHHLRGADVQVAMAEWMISDRPRHLPGKTNRVRRFPLMRVLSAFDFSLSAAGYNSFHDVLLAGLPTLFVPNEHPQQDDQLTRARYAERHGLGLCVRCSEIYHLKNSINRLLDPEERTRLRANCAGLDRTNGAIDAALLIEELAYALDKRGLRG